MLIRFLSMMQIALDRGSVQGICLSVTLSHSAVLFLRSDASAADSLRIEILTPEERSREYYGRKDFRI
ncbi:hypothetical protein [Candidatus Merdisoma sp. JLR.KK006]|uniref:hypothetical protein n=1 Tax=Candidatus Merdisoma sp. JLR.KK006 TaxID=3112626 RepID=UPI002FEE8E08